MNRFTTLAVALSVSAAPAIAAEDTDALWTVLSDHGCAVAPMEVADLFSPEGFRPEFVRDTLAALYLDGVASEDAEGRLGIPPTLCPPLEAKPSPKARVLATIRADACMTPEAELRAAHADLDDAQFEAIFAPLAEAGDLSIDGDFVRLTADACFADESL